MIRVNKIYDLIKCLIIENFQNGTVTVEYNKSKFEEILKENTFWEVTKIYEITKETRELLVNKLLQNSEVNEDGKAQSSISETELIVDILPIISDIPYDLSLEEDMEELKERLENPTEVLQKISKVVYTMLITVFNDFIKDTKEIENLPKETQELLQMALEKEELQKQLDEENELKDSVKELETIVGK
jgi:hypothetical protein